MPRALYFSLLAALALADTLSGAQSSAEFRAQMERGESLYIKTCSLCHQVTGAGIPEVCPPLAQSDFLMADRERAIRIGCEGIGGEIVVNGKKYSTGMPVVALRDEEIADVFTYIFNSWGNRTNAVAVAEVTAVRAKTEFTTYDALVRASTYPPLPAPPEGFTLREVARLPARGGQGVRLHS